MRKSKVDKNTDLCGSPNVGYIHRAATNLHYGEKNLESGVYNTLNSQIQTQLHPSNSQKKKLKETLILSFFFLSLCFIFFSLG